MYPLLRDWTSRNREKKAQVINGITKKHSAEGIVNM